MIGILYIILCTLCGCALCRLLFKNLKQPAYVTGLPAFMVELPAWYLTGTLTVTWLVYLIAYCFQDAKEPLRYGNMVAWFLVIVFLAAAVIFDKEKKLFVTSVKEFFFMEMKIRCLRMLLFTMPRVWDSLPRCARTLLCAASM